MAAYLKFDGGNDYVSIPSGMTLSSVGDYFEFEVDIVSAAGYVFAGTPSSFGSIFAYDTTRYRFRVPTSGTTAEITAPVPSGRTVMRLTREASGYDLIVDGTSLGSFSQPAGLSPIVLGLWSINGTYSSLRLYSFEYGNTSGIIRYYDPSATGGTGSVLEDTVGANDGALVGLPTDDSQWVFNSWSDVGFTRLGSLTAPSVTGSASDLPTLVKYEDFTSTMLANLDSGGGDLRFSSDEAGTTQLACEVVTFTKATGDVVWVKVPSVATGALIYVWGDNTGAVQPAVGAAFGRNAVWVGEDSRYHLSTGTGNAVDSKGVENGVLTGGTTTQGTPIAGFGNSTVLNNAPYYTRSDPFSGAATFGANTWFNTNTNTTTYGLLSAWDNPTANTDMSVLWWATALGKINVRAKNTLGTVVTAAGTTILTIGQDYFLSVIYDGTTLKSYINGVEEGSIAFTGTIDTSTVPFEIFSYNRGIAAADGKAQELAIGDRTPAQIAIEYDNQSAVGSWWTAADEGGGPATQILTPTAIASLETWGSPSVYNVLQILAASGIATGELWGAHTVSTTSGTSILQPSGVASLESWGTPVVTPLIVQIVATAISSLEAWGTPSVLSGVSVLTATGVSSEEAWGTVTLSNLKQYLLASGVISAEAWGNPVLEVLLKVLVAQSIVSGEAWGLPLLAGGDALVVPVAYRQTYNDIAAFLRTQLIKGQDNEVILKWLSNEGYIGNFNEALDDYLRDLGKAGGLQDKFANWRDE